MKILVEKKIIGGYLFLAGVLLLILAVPLLGRPEPGNWVAEFDHALETAMFFPRFIIIYFGIVIISSLAGWLLSKNARRVQTFKLTLVSGLVLFIALFVLANTL